MKVTLETMSALTTTSKFIFNHGRFTTQYSTKSLMDMSKFSKLGIDIAERGYALEFIFHESVIKFIPSKTQSSVFYHSKLPRITLEKLTEGKTQFEALTKDSFRYRFVGVESHVTARCRDKGDTVVGKEYYCKAKDIIIFSKKCAKLNDVTPCLFHPLFQDHFSYGRFAVYSELNVINTVTSRTKTVLTAFKDKVKNNDANGLSSLLTKYSPYVKVKDSMCVLDWPKAFDCQTNAACSFNKAMFDCNGGYTCRIKTMYRFDCMIKFVMTSAKKYTDLINAGSNLGAPVVLRAKYDVMIWLSYLPMGRYSSLTYADINNVILSTQKTANNYVTSYDTTGLTTFSKNLPPVTLVPFWAKNAACQTTTIATAYTIYCALDPLVNSIFMFLDAFKNSQKASIKVLNPTVDYNILIGQLQIQRVQSYIVLQTETYFNDLTSQLKQNFAALSTYFSTLADYDKTKANADIAYIDGRLTTFKTKITTISASVGTMLSTVFKFSIGANIAELYGRSIEVGVAIAQVANPLSEILGGSSITDLLSAINELAQAGVQTAIIGYLGDKAMPDLIAKGQALGTGFAANEKQFLEAKNLIAGLKKKTEDAYDTSKKFLVEYTKYDPKILRSDITLYGKKFETVAEQLCNAAFAGGTAASALVEIGLASKGECTKLSAVIAQLITVYEEVYDYQDDLMSSLSSAARAYLAYEKANEMKLIYSQGPRVNKAFLQKIAVNTFMVSTMNVWQIVTEYCDILTYTSGGAVPTKCTTALTTPSHKAVAQVLGYSPAPLCHVNNEITDFRDIPIKSSGSGDTAYIDLEKLYKGKPVTFKVQNFQWLKDQDWVGSQDSNQAIYIKRFEIFLPPMSGTTQKTIAVSAAPHSINYLKPGGSKYRLQVSGYTTRYTENSFNCYSQKIDNPYTLCDTNTLSKLCVTSNGYVNRKIQPSIFNDEWTITATNLPANEKVPKAVTTFKLQVGITMCMVNMPSKKKRNDSNLNAPTGMGPHLKLFRSPGINKRGTLQCCASTQYWNGAACTTCPAGSTQKLKGYYCQ